MGKRQTIWGKRLGELESYINQGLSNKEIANKFNSTVGAVSSAISKLGLSKKPKIFDWNIEKQNLERLIIEGSTVSDLCTIYKGVSETTMRRQLRNLGLKAKTKRIVANSKYGSTDEEFKLIVKDSNSYSDICRRLGLREAGGNISTVKKRISKLNLDISHFYSKPLKKTTLTKDEIFTVTETGSRSVASERIKSTLLGDNMKPYKCECCGNTEWNDLPIPLQLHHKDGNFRNNTLENLQLLCPNCHSLTDNYCGRNKKSPSQNP